MLDSNKENARKLAEKLVRMALGSTPKMRRVLTYWAATAILYILYLFILSRELEAGAIDRDAAGALRTFGLFGVGAFYILLRCAPVLGIPNWKLALSQALFAIVCNLALYCVLDALRGAVLIGMPMVIVFCAFALRPRQTIALSAFAIVSLAATIAALVQWHPERHPLYEESVHFALAAIGIVSVSAITAELSKLRAQLLKAVATIRTLATTDELTLLANRRHMNDLLALAGERRAARAQHVCVALIDIDFFKAINDKYGHAGGDAVLKAFAQEAGATLRATDTLARWGGEEFLLLMPDTKLEEALSVIDRMAARIATMRLAEVAPGLKVSFSAGVAASGPLERFDQAIGRADEAMYRAKKSGRNCILAA